MLTVGTRPYWNIRQNKYWTVYSLDQKQVAGMMLEKLRNVGQQGISEPGKLGAKWMEKTLSQAKTRLLHLTDGEGVEVSASSKGAGGRG